MSKATEHNATCATTIPMETLLRLSNIQVELMTIAKGLAPRPAKIVGYAANVLHLVREVARAQELELEQAAEDGSSSSAGSG